MAKIIFKEKHEQGTKKSILIETKYKRYKNIIKLSVFINILLSSLLIHKVYF